MSVSPLAIATDGFVPAVPLSIATQGFIVPSGAPATRLQYFTGPQRLQAGSLQYLRKTRSPRSLYAPPSAYRVSLFFASLKPAQKPAPDVIALPVPVELPTPEPIEVHEKLQEIPPQPGVLAALAEEAAPVPVDPPVPVEVPIVSPEPQIASPEPEIVSEVPKPKRGRLADLAEKFAPKKKP